MRFSSSKIITGLIRICPLALIALLSGCKLDDRMSTFDPKGPVAQSQLDLFMVTVWVSTFIFITVGGALAWAVIRYREKKGDRDKPMPPQKHGHPLVEVGLIILSAALLVIIAVPTLKGIWNMYQLPENEESKLKNWYGGEIAEDEQDDVLTVRVTGYQWWWRFDYPQLGITTANEIILPKNKVVKLELRSADVIHSFWLPKIAGKTDMIPGRANWMWLQADEAGHYYGQCAEFCGESHAYMLFRADVLEDKAFKDWVDHQKKEAKPSEIADIIEGEKLFTQKTCIQCHKIKGNPVAMGELGPDLTHVASRKSLAAGFMDHMNIDGSINKQKQYDNLFKWVKESYAVKPGNLMYYPDNGLKNVEMSDDEVRKIVLYLQSLN